MKIVLPYPPTLNHLYATVRGHRVLSKQGKAFKKTAGVLALAAGVRPISGPIHVTVRVYRPRRSGDLDNSLKATIDSLKGIAWADDEQVCRISAERFEDKANPRAEIEIVAAPLAGDGKGEGR